MTDGVLVELGSSATVTLGFKSALTTSTYLVPAVTATKTGTGTSAVYTLAPTFLSSTLDTLLGTADSVSVYGELKIVDGSETDISEFRALIYKNVNQGGETAAGVQVTGSVTYLTSVTRLTGGVAATDLDAVPTVSLPVGTLIRVVVSGVESAWRVEAGTAVTNTATGVIRPTDYNASTNAKNLVRVAGL